MSSVEIYGENKGDTETFDENYLGYINCNTLRAGYPESKRLSESLCQAYIGKYNMDIVIGRLSRNVQDVFAVITLDMVHLKEAEQLYGKSYNKWKKRISA